MEKNCIYCNVAIGEDSVVDVCQKCGVGVWGEKMFSAIIENMKGARESGDLYQGSVSEDWNKPKKEENRALSSMTEESRGAIEEMEQNKYLEHTEEKIKVVPQSEIFVEKIKISENSDKLEVLEPSQEVDEPEEEEILSHAQEVKVLPRADDLISNF